MSSVRQLWQALAQLTEASRRAKGKAVDDGESSGKRTKVAGKPSTSVVGVPAQAKRPQSVMLNKAPSNEQYNQLAWKRSKLK